MSLSKRFDRNITVIFIATVIVVMTASYFTFNKVFREHITHQQQATVPLITLAMNEIIRPLTIAHHMATNYFIQQIAQQEEVDKQRLLNYLSTIGETYDLLAFIAIEKQQLMLTSKGKELLFTEDRPEWYYRLKQLPGEKFTDIGNRDDPHLYFDIKLRDRQGEFLGFIGVGADLDYFAKRFKEYSERYGYELYMADENHNITVTSSSFMKTSAHHREQEIVNLATLPWFAPFRALEQAGQAHQIIKSEESNYVVSKLTIPELNWSLYLVSPPPVHQEAYWRQFASKVLVILSISFVLYFSFIYVVRLFKKDLLKDSKTDFLTQLPNRSFVNWKMADIHKRHKHLCVVLADIDNFKKINDNYGHLAGDEVLRKVAQKLSETLRQFDILARWGGEEFILLLPDTDSEQAFEIADRIRQSLIGYEISGLDIDSPISITISLGIAQGALASDKFNDMLKQADKALYQAKTQGRNQVVTYQD